MRFSQIFRFSYSEWCCSGCAALTTANKYTEVILYLKGCKKTKVWGREAKTGREWKQWYRTVWWTHEHTHCALARHRQEPVRLRVFSLRCKVQKCDPKKRKKQRLTAAQPFISHLRFAFHPGARVEAWWEIQIFARQKWRNVRKRTRKKWKALYHSSTQLIGP